MRESVHIVLVEPQESLNIGSVVRAMSNLGFENLHLVASRCTDLERARITACAGAPLLEKIRQHERLETCLAPMQLVVGFSGQHGKHRPQHVLLPEWVTTFHQHPAFPVALLFGPEDTGLRMEHLAHCRWTVRISSAAENPSYNLAQSVLLVLHEITRIEWAHTSTRRERASMEDQYQLDRVVEEVLTRCEFYREGTPAPIPDLVKNMLRRIEADPREMSVLLALFARINSTLSRLGK